MLTLPTDWSRFHGGYLAIHLCEQLDERSLRDTCERRLIEAALKLMAQTFPSRHWPSENDGDGTLNTGDAPKTQRDSPLRRVKRFRFGWHIGGLTYVYLPVLHDRLLTEFQASHEEETGVIVIAPPGQDITLDHTLRLRGKRLFAGTVTSFHFFLSWRVTSASLDAKLSHEETLRRLFRIYNSTIGHHEGKDRVRIKIPSVRSAN